MQGLMQQVALTVPTIFRRAERIFAGRPVVTAGRRGADGSTLPHERTTYGGWAARTRRLGGALDQLGVSPSGRVGTFGWNTARHLELYFAAPCTGRVLHTLNIRLFADQLVYVVNHAEDEVIFADRSLLAVLWPLIDRMPTVRQVVVMDDGPGELPDDPRILDYEELVAGAREVDFAVDDEHRAAAMCYTSGTTGNPKGVVYSHRSTVLHSMGAMLADTIGVSMYDTVLPVVPMFHANAWGLAHAGVFAGSCLVLPGADLSPKALAGLISDEGVTIAAGVPTIWMAVLPELEGRDLSRLRTAVAGGSAVPEALSESFRARIGLPLLQAWGMTETSPLASVARVRPDLADRPEEQLAGIRATQGIPSPAVDLRIVGPDSTDELPWDGTARGELQARGPWIARDYYALDHSEDSFTSDGWLRTGDVATISPEGYVRLVDRTKDVIKSGGEWISSVDLENEIMAHPAVREAAVIAVPHDRWVERPLACVVCREGETLDAAELLAWLEPRVARWWLPDAVEFIDEVPKTSVGKFSKQTLRERFGGYRLPG